ncbi:MAG: glycerol acyltransferase [Bacteroidetes bacterium]|nr:MAG: glycerol acyltransferase [Bacteroidota bacterium]
MATYYPTPGFHFKVEFDIGGIKEEDVHFQEVNGLSVDIETETIKEGGENRFSQQLPNRSTYSNLILKRGILVDSGIINWCKDAIEKLDIKPATIWVKVLNEQHQPLQTFSFIKAWPKKWELSGLNAQQSGLLIETIEFAYQYFKKVE